MYTNSYSVKHNLRKLFIHHYERYLPTAFDESMSLLEKMNKLIQSQNELIEAMNTHTEHTSETIERAFDIIDTNIEYNLNNFRDELTEQTRLYEEIRDKIHSDLLPDSVKQKLEEWLLNGTIKDLITDTVFADFVSRITELENRMEDMELIEDVSLGQFYYMADELSDGTYDWTKPFKHALSISNNVHIPEGEYKMHPIGVQSNKRITGRGSATKLNVSRDSSDRNFNVFNLEGEAEKIRRVTTKYEKSSNVLYIEDTAGLKPGDDIVIKSQKNALDIDDAGADWVLGAGTGSNPQRLPFGEFAKIKGVEDDHIVLSAALIYPYYGSHNGDESRPAQDFSTVQKVNFVENVVIKDLEVNNLYSGFVLNTMYAKDVLMDGVHFDNSKPTYGYRGMTRLQMSLNCEIRNSTYFIPQDHSVDKYYKMNAFRITGGQNCGFKNCKATNSEQSVDLSFIGGWIPNTGCYIDGFTAINARTTGITTHGGNYLTKITNCHIEGTEQGIGTRGRGGLIANNTIIGTSFHKSDTTLSNGIHLYQHGAVDIVITGNIIRNFGNGIGYSDGNDSRVLYLNTLITNNNIDNCSTAIKLYRYHSGGSAVPDEDLMVRISNNTIKMKNNIDSSPVYGIYINERNGGVVVSGNTFKGIRGEMVGYIGDRTNNYTAVKIFPNVNNVQVYDNAFYDIDRGINHDGTVSPHTPGVFPDGVNFYHKNNQRVRVRLSDSLSSGINTTANQYMSARGTLSSISTERQPISYYGTVVDDLREPDDLTKIRLSAGVWMVSWKFEMIGFSNTKGTSTIRVTVNGKTILNYTVFDSRSQSLNTLIKVKEGDLLQVDVQNSNSDMITGFKNGVGDNKFTVTNISRQ